MRLIIKLIKRTSNSEQGFVLIVAIMAIVILTAIGFFALTMISGDLIISSRLTGERKALSAAESGVHAIYASTSSIIDLVNAYPTSTPSTCFQVDPTSDPSTCYTLENGKNTNVQATVGGGSCTNCKSFIYNMDITGKDSNYDSSMTISIGLSPPSTQSDTNIIPGTQPGE
jgi:Tfp pilus assembly protein PilX